MSEKQQLPAERCETCRFFGRVVDATLAPSGQCCKSAPGAYTVVRHTWSPGGPTGLMLVQSREVATSFPPVWPTDHCGEYEAKAA